MAKDPNFVSVRLPDDVAELLRAYATDKKLVRAGNPNMGGSIIAILRAALQGQTNSNNVGQSSDLDESLIDRIDYLERANRVGQKEVDERFDEFDEHYCKLLNQHKENIGEKIAALVARLEALEANRTEATAPAKKPLMLSQNQKVIAMQKLQDTA
jgi:hypothetical protein